MSTEYSLYITDKVINHFNKILHQPFKKEEGEIVSAVKQTLNKLKSNKVEDYVVDHIKPLEELLELISDEKWEISDQDKSYVLSALQYFAEEHDVIPDDIPVVGYLDDCIVIDIVVKKLKLQLDEHRQFIKASMAYSNNHDYSVDDWRNTQRKELFSRLRHRRLKGLKSHHCRGTSFSM